jgi:hypothetical protein
VQSYHGHVLEIAIVIVLLAALALLIGPRIRGRRGIGGERAMGTLLVTGISPKPDAEGEQFVTINGVMNGPTVNEYPVYARLVVDVNAWPSMGDLIPVVYSAKNPDNWEFASPEQPSPGSYQPPPPSPPPATPY